MPHKIDISDKTYDRLKEYCTLNNLRIGQFADKLIFDGLMIEIYGDVPFTNYKKPPKKEMVEIPVPDELKKQEPPPPESREVIDDRFWEMLDDKKKEEEPKPEPVKETLKQAGVPTKVVNKITKRRLK